MTLGHAEIRWKSALERKLQHFCPCGFCGFFRHERLILNQPTATVRQFPVRNVIEKKVKGRMGLSERMARQTGDIFSSVHPPRSQIVHERPHEIMQDRFRKNQKKTQ